MKKMDDSDSLSSSSESSGNGNYLIYRGRF